MQSVGTEILLGDILNTNSKYLSVQLAKLGISVLRHTTVGDNPERLAAALRTALERSDIVIATGGLGPTADDITRDVCCEVMGFELTLDQKIADGIRSYFESKGIEMPESNLRQAYVPVGGTVFENNHGTAPGLGLKKNGKCVCILPGPPYEMAPMYHESVVPYLAEYSEGSIVSHTVRTMGIGESAMAELCSDLLEKEKGISKEYMFEKVEAALVSAYKKEEGSTSVRVAINRDKRQLKLWVVQTCGGPRPWDKARANAADEFFKTKIEILDLSKLTDAMKDLANTEEFTTLTTLVKDVQSEIKKNRNHNQIEMVKLDEILQKLFQTLDIVDLANINEEFRAILDGIRRINEENERISARYGGNYAFVKTYTDAIEVHPDIDKEVIARVVDVIFEAISEIKSANMLILQGRDNFMASINEKTTIKLIKEGLYDDANLDDWYDDLLAETYTNMKIF